MGNFSDVGQNACPLQQFKKRKGHCNAPSWHKQDEADLGRCANAQGKLKKNKKPDSDRQKLLDNFGFKEWVTSART
jgi:hypothetical protein